MAVRLILKSALESVDDTAGIETARAWLDRVEVLLEWIAQHPKLVEIRSEAARLLVDYRGSPIGRNTDLGSQNTDKAR